MTVESSSPPKTMRTPLAQVRYLGASHSGTSDFWRQRVTAVAMTLLIVPVIVVVMMLLGRNQAGAAHVMANNFFSTAVALAAIYAILKLSSGV